AFSIAVAMASTSSATTMIASTSNPAPPRISRTAGPLRSSRSPRDAASEQVMTRTRIIARDSSEAQRLLLPTPARSHRAGAARARALADDGGHAAGLDRARQLCQLSGAAYVGRCRGHQ